jgi:predicted PurR-regulated permease PerM
LGVGGILIPWAVVALVSGAYGLALSLLILYGVIFIARQTLEPKIVGEHIGLPPIVTLFSMYVGLKVMGLFGAILFPMIVITLKYMQSKGYLALWK